MSEPVPVVILAGGQGTRMGGDKPLRMLAQERLIDRALRQASRWSQVIAVSVRDGSQVQPINAAMLTDERSVEGPLAGLIAALRFGIENGAEHVMTIAADMPFLPIDLLERLIAAIDGHGCALASSGGHLHPVCGLWRTATRLEISRYAEEGGRSIRGFATRIGVQSVEWPAQPVDPFFNINTSEDLKEAERLV